MIVETFPVGALQCNCSILVCDETKEAVIVDPGGEASKILARVKELGADVRYVIHTHGHIDHIGATRQVSREIGGEILLHEKDLFLYENLKMQAEWLAGMGVPASILGIEEEETTPPHRFVDDGEEIPVGRSRLAVVHTPGHTPGSICFRNEENDAGRVFSGDTLFAGGIGRTDLWGGDYAQIIDSIRGRILRYDDDTTIVPGHGPTTTVGAERRSNPFLQ